MIKRRILSVGVTIMLVLSLCCTPVLAANSNIVSQDTETGITIYRDSGGGLVFSGLPTTYVASPAERSKSHEAADNYNLLTRMPTPIVKNGSPYVDYENNPIHIGTWGGVKAYARHTLGDYNRSEEHLTSYGYVTYYNTSGDTAVPYRNGNATVAGQDVVDVAKGDSFSIRDLGTGQSTTLKITDWGPDQQQHGNADGRERIADLDKSDFKSLHGNTSDGVLYARTWVPVTHYNP